MGRWTVVGRSLIASNIFIAPVPVEADKTYKVAGWASVQEGVQGEPIWDVVAGYLRNQKVIKNTQVNVPRITGMDGNPGIAF